MGFIFKGNNCKTGRKSCEVSFHIVPHRIFRQDGYDYFALPAVSCIHNYPYINSKGTCMEL